MSQWLTQKPVRYTNKLIKKTTDTNCQHNSNDQQYYFDIIVISTNISIHQDWVILSYCDGAVRPVPNDSSMEICVAGFLQGGQCPSSHWFTVCSGYSLYYFAIICHFWHYCKCFGSFIVLEQNSANVIVIVMFSATWAAERTHYSGTYYWAN